MLTRRCCCCKAIANCIRDPMNHGPRRSGICKGSPATRIKVADVRVAVYCTTLPLASVCKMYKMGGAMAIIANAGNDLQDVKKQLWAKVMVVGISGRT